MIRFGAIFTILTLSSAALAQTDSSWLNWVAANSPNGFDFTPDGTIWINVAQPGDIDDYAIRAGDLQEARETKNRKPSFWVRGYHIRNSKVAYRESKIRYTLNCESESIARNIAAYYDKDGRQLWQEGYYNSGYIIPGTYGAEYYRLFCVASDSTTSSATVPDPAPLTPDG